jgi:hypothetical protein
MACALTLLALLAIALGRARADAPAGRYSITNDQTPTGTVLDNQTGLTWQQTVPPTAYSWADAKSYCSANQAGLPGSGWRLPSPGELQSIVDDSRLDPSIDPKAFPATPSDMFWTSSAYLPNPNNVAWGVPFVDGNIVYTAVDNSWRVRCVR